MKTHTITLPIFGAALLAFPLSAYAGPTMPYTQPPGLTLFVTDGGVSGDAASIFDVDPTTGTIGTPVDTGDSLQIFSLATEPGTDRIHCVYQADEDSGLSLGIIEPATGVVTKVVDFIFEGVQVEDGIPGIAFDCEGGIYAVSAGRFPDATTMPAGTDGQIFRVDRITGVMTLLVVGSEGSGQCIEYNPADGLLYHWFNADGPAMETIDPTAPTTPIPVPLTGDVYSDNIQAVVYAGDSRFIGHQVGLSSFYLITSAGEVTMIGPSPSEPRRDRIRGMAFDRAIGCDVFQPDLLIGKRLSALNVDNFYTRTGHRQTIRRLPRGRVGRNLRIPLALQNDGTADDRIHLSWNFTDPARTIVGGTRERRFRRQVLLTGQGRVENVSSMIRSRGIALAPGEKRFFIFKLSVRGLPFRGISRRVATFRAVSARDGSKVDVGVSIFRFKS